METMMMMWQSHELGWRLWQVGVRESQDVCQIQSKAYGLRKALELAGVSFDKMDRLADQVEAFAALVSVGLMHENDFAAYIAEHKEG